MGFYSLCCHVPNRQNHFQCKKLKISEVMKRPTNAAVMSEEGFEQVSIAFLNKKKQIKVLGLDS